MKRTTQIIFIITTLILISLPLAFFNARQTISPTENRALAKKPLLFKDGRFNENFFSDCDSYIQDHIGFRDQLIQIDSKQMFKVSSKKESALKGKDGWYFFIDTADGNNLMDFYKRNLFDSAQAEQFSNRISKTVDWCKEQNIPCVFLICPNKHSIYEEFYPLDRPAGITRGDQICGIFEKIGARHLFPRDFLISKKSEYNFPLYYETDSHWNPQGAYLASTLLKKEIESIFPNVKFPDIEYETSIEYSVTYGDLLPLLKIKKAKSAQPKLEPKETRNKNLYEYIKNDGLNGIHTKSADKKLPRALIYRDSFFVMLEPFISPLFSEAEYIWKTFSESDKYHVMEFKPDIIIFEIAERNAPSIIN